MVRECEITNENVVLDVYLTDGSKYIGVDIPPKPFSDGCVSFFPYSDKYEMWTVPLSRVVNVVIRINE